MFACFKCRKNIELLDINNITECDGICQNKYHTFCLNLTVDEVKLLQTNKNISWKCDLCLLICSDQLRNQLEKIVNNKFDKYIEYNELRIQQLIKSFNNCLLIQDKYNSSKTSLPERNKPYKFISNRKAVVITSSILLLTLLVGILIVTTSSLFKSTGKSKQLLGDGDDSRKNIPINSTIDNNEDNDDGFKDGALNFVERHEWEARPSGSDQTNLQLPAHRVIISHTASDTCNSIKVCSYRIQIVQAFHMDSQHWADIGYNFLIGGDGRIYVGRGWDIQGAHTKGYNRDTIGISFIGTYTTVAPTERQLASTQLLLAEGVRLKKLVPDYRLYGARQLSGTESPGNDNIGSGKILKIVARDGWLAQPSTKPLIPNSLPVHRVIVLPTQTDICMTQAACTYRVRFLQTFNIESLQNDDIIYNYLIGGDGTIYEGRGWNFKGAHLRGYNDDSVSFAFIGTFRKQKPSDKQMNVTKLLLERGVNEGKLAEDYKILSAYKLDPTSTTTQSDALYESFKNWPHWSDD